MLTNIITNPIDTPYGYKNPVHGIALRGPLSQFFSGIYLKPLDDAFDNTMVTYIRFQDDLLILCKTKRQMQRAKRRMMEVLHERRLTLSRKKSRMGTIESGFHFLGVQYSLTQMENNTRVKHANDDVITAVDGTDFRLKIWEKTAGAWSKDSRELDRMLKRRRKIELEASAKRKKAW